MLLQRSLAGVAASLAIGVVVLCNPLQATSADCPVDTSNPEAQAAAFDWAERCDRSALMHARVVELGDDPAMWTMSSDLPPNWFGSTDTVTGAVEIATSVPCQVLPSVVNHEYAHRRQIALGLAREFDREIIADCASFLLGSVVTPYLGDCGCTSHDLDVARELLGDAI